jgi:hypothetical protein
MQAYATSPDKTAARAPIMAQSAAGAQRADKFYLLTSADQMTATFNTSTNLTKLRVAQ